MPPSYLIARRVSYPLARICLPVLCLYVAVPVILPAEAFRRPRTALDGAEELHAPVVDVRVVLVPLQILLQREADTAALEPACIQLLVRRPRPAVVSAKRV